MVLQVRAALSSDVYRDIARVPELFRRDRSGRMIPEATLCEVRSTRGSTFLFVRGYQDLDEPVILMDERTRNLLKVSLGELADLEFTKCDACGELKWAWNASEPAYRIAVRLGILSILLGMIGVGIAIVPFFR